MKKVKDMLSSKTDADTHMVSSNTLVWDAIRLMSDNHVGALLVVDHGKLVGIVSERDYLRKVALMGRSSQSTRVSEIMTANPISVSPDETLEVCMEFMTEKRIRHLPVLAGEKILGMLSIRDLLENIMQEQKSLIVQLEQYIRGEVY